MSSAIFRVSRLSGNAARPALMFGVLGLGVLVLLDIAVRVRASRQTPKPSAFTELFDVETARSNDFHATIIKDRKTGKPLWGAWNLVSSTGQVDTVVSFYLEGLNLMNVYRRPTWPPKVDVAFYDENGTVQASGLTGEPTRGLRSEYGTVRRRHDGRSGSVTPGISLSTKQTTVSPVPG